MQFFIDTANIEDIKKTMDTGLIDGVTTNPSLIASTGESLEKVIKRICAIVSGPVSAEVGSTEYKAMVEEGQRLAEIADNVVVKLPLTVDGLKACAQLALKDIETNVTLCFTANQALLAAKAGATYISPFVGRLDDISADGMAMVYDIADIYANYSEFQTKILVASIRNPLHVMAAAKAGAEVATIGPKVFWQLFHHPLTDSGIETFLNDWKKTKS